MAYNTPESVADYLSRFQMQVTERTKGTFSPMHVSEFTTGRWRVHLVYPGEPRADGGLPKSENENPPLR